MNTEQNTLGDVEQIQFNNIGGYPKVKGKVDTGSDVSSLHVDEFSIKNSDGDEPMVSFRSSAISNNIITVPLHRKIAISSSDGGSEYRPVVLLNITIGDVKLQGVEFNLNNREHMQYKVLIGQNILEKGKFLIDPSINESDSNATYTVSITVSTKEAAEAVEKFAGFLKRLGEWGSSREFGITDPSDDDEKLMTISFDGDGADKVLNVSTSENAQQNESELDDTETNLLKRVNTFDLKLDEILKQVNEIKNGI